MKIEGFTVEKKLAEGRISTLVRATEEKTERTVALKILHRHLVDEEPIRMRLRRELAALRRVEHPAIVRVEDIIEDEKTVALVLEYVDGESIRERVEREGPMEWPEVKPILASVLEGLEEAHEAGIWHRDLNAEHILIDNEGRGRIVGFGMARVDELVGLTMHTRVLGALEAMAPERILGLEYDGRADLYSVGAIAHEMLLGHPPTGGTMQAAFSHASTEQKVDEDLPDDLPPPARYILERSLVGDAAARFATASQMRRALDGVYDEKMWRTWTTRESTRCPECDAPVIVALGECVECGHDLRRLVRQPGRGEYYLEIISPHEAFIPDVWFEHNSEPDYLPNDEMVALMELLGAYQDTRPRANWATQYRDPPYLLFAELTREDVERVGEELDERSIPHRISSRPPEPRRRWLPSSTGMMVALTLVVLVCLPMAAILSGMFETPALAVGVSSAASVMGGLGVWMTYRRLKAKFGSQQEQSAINGRPLMIPNEVLATGGNDSLDALPDRTVEVLTGLQTQQVRRELYEILVLALAAAERAVQVGDASFSALVDEVLDLGVQLDDLAARIEEGDVADIYRRIERLEAKLEDDRDDGTEEGEEPTPEELREEYRACLDELEEYDRLVAKSTHLRSSLQVARGELFDLYSVAQVRSEAREEIVLDIEDGPEERLDDLRLRLEAAAEVDALVESDVQVEREVT